MKMTMLALLALAALAAACHEQRQDPPIDTNGIRARAGQYNDELQRQTPPAPRAQ